MNAERVFRILWGPTLENALDFTWPVVGSAPTFSRSPRAGAVLVPNGAGVVASVQGRYYRLSLRAQYFGAAQNFGALGLQAFLDWAADSNPFTLVPHTGIPTLTVTGCYLEGPFLRPSVSLERDSSQTLTLTILHPTIDLGLAWRGLYFEYAAGQSLTDPTSLYVQSRASIAYEIGPDAYLHQIASGVIADGHYPNGTLDGLQTVSIQPAVTNDVASPEDLTANAPAGWTKNECTITANNAFAPDKSPTADLVVESVTVGAIHTCVSNAITIGAGNVQTAVAFVRASGRYNGILWFNDSIGGAGGNRCGIQFDLNAGTAFAATIGTGTLQAFSIIPLAGGWYRLYIRGALGGAITTSYLALRLGDAVAAFTYTGDGVSGMYFWGATAVQGGTNSIARYTPTTSVSDKLTTPFTTTGMLTTPQQSFWLYAKWVDEGTAYLTAYPRIVSIGTSNTPSIIVFGNKTNSGNNRYGLEGWGAANLFSIDDWPTTTVNPGDTVEMFATIVYSAATGFWTATLSWSLNGGAVTTLASNTSSQPVPPAWGTQTILFADIGVTSVGCHGMATLKLGPYVASGPASVGSLVVARFA